MIKKRIILALLLGIEVTPGFCDLNDLCTKYHLLAVTQNREELAAVRKSICSEEFLADKFVSFCKVQNAIDFLDERLANFGARAADQLVGSMPRVGVMPRFAQIIYDMRNFSGDHVPELVSSISEYDPEEIITAMNTLVEALGTVQVQDLLDDEVENYLNNEIAEFQEIAQNIADTGYLDALISCAEDILDILDVPPPQSLYDTLVSLQESNNYVDNVVAETQQKVRNVEKRVNFMMRMKTLF